MKRMDARRYAEIFNQVGSPVSKLVLTALMKARGEEIAVAKRLLRKTKKNRKHNNEGERPMEECPLTRGTTSRAIQGEGSSQGNCDEGDETSSQKE